jgi:C-terminal processing protease CtpA/Prc
MFGFRVKNWEQGGAEIVKITPDSPADVAGLHVGDV